ncbi:MAG: DUF5320 domain-containing protein [Actinomycetia bacterium]|nr:DUF5320 domain-containing protein [Actinomycetes bacterium]
MPGLDGTGPAGQGPMTGGGRGTCVTDDETVVARIKRRTVTLGRGRGGAGRGLGFGFGLGGGRALPAQGRGAGRWWSR